MKKIILAIICILILGIFAGCSVKKLRTEKLRDIEFTVVLEKDIPEELEEMLDEKDGWSAPGPQTPRSERE